MASTLLTGNDFVSNSNLAHVGQNGEVTVDVARDNDYTIGIVSRDAFDFTTGNKSARFVFSVAPNTTAARRGIFGAASAGKFIALIDDGQSVEWSGDTFDNACPGTPDCATMNQYACSTFYMADTSSTHSIVKTGQSIGVAGNNDNGEITISSPETVESFGCGNGFTIIMRNDGSVELIGDDHNGDISIPQSAIDFNDTNRPIMVSAGEDFIAILSKDGTVSISGSGYPNTIDSEGIPIVAISAGSSHLAALTLTGGVLFAGDSSFGQSSDVPFKALKISAGANRTAILGEDGKTYSMGEGVSGIQENTDVPAGSVVVDVIAGDGFTVSVLKTRDFIVSGTSPSYISDMSGKKIGDKRTVNDVSDAYDMFPMLRDITGFNAFFGVQNDQLDQTFNMFTDGVNSQPVVVGRDGYQSIFQGLRGGFKGTILSKVDDYGDVCFDLTGSEYDPFSSSGHLPVSTEFITSSESEKYEVIVSFGPFGKVIKFRKVNGGYWTEMPFKHISIEETGYQAGRLAIYIRNAKDFVLHYAEVTDELDTALLPPEIVYRDIDTAVLHTKAAELVVDMADAIETVSDGVKKNSDKILELNTNYREKLADIFARLETLEG